MKTIYFMLAVLLSSVVFISCSEDDTIYSCDTTVNSWVKQNIPEIHKMTRADWLRTTSELAIPTYRAFTEEQKVLFWKEKFQEIKKLSWTPKELNHIHKVELFMANHPYVFSNTPLTDIQLDEIELFFYNWRNEAIEQLKWKPEVCIAIAGSGYKMKNKEGEIIFLPSTRGSKMSMSAESSCHCNTGLLSDFCFNAPGPCEDSDCESSSVGCGWLLAQSCNGRCGGL